MNRPDSPITRRASLAGLGTMLTGTAAASLYPLDAEAQLRLFRRRESGSANSSGPVSEDELTRRARRYNLVLMKRTVPGIFIDLRYTVTSAAKRPLYVKDMPCLVHKSTADKLNRVNQQMRDHGYALKIWDAWRPPEAHQALWDAVQDERYVVPPSKGLSWHCYGISIDLTLVKPDGSPVKMPTDYDEFSLRAASGFTGGDPAVVKRLHLLQEKMVAVGFRTIKSEWWHFDDMNAAGGLRHVTAKDLGIAMP